MNREEQFVITISRQFGTGGHEIGAELPRRLNVKLLDKQILNEMAKKSRIVEEAMEKIEARNPLWRDDFTDFYRNYMSRAEYSGLEHDQTSHDLFEAQAETIRQIVEEESCVIVGRCASFIFKDHDNALKIYLHSPMEKRIKRIVDKYGVTEADAKLMIVDNDYTRELYTKKYTGSEWFDARNYDIALDVSKFGLNGSVDYLLAFVGE